MNMTSVLHRRRTAGAADLVPVIPDLAPPRPPGRQAPTPWPSNARRLVAVLAAASVLAAILLVITAISADDGRTERVLGVRIDALTAERDDAMNRVAGLDAEIATAREELLVARNGNDDLTEQMVDLEARVADLVDERAEALQAVDDLTGALDEARADIDVLTVSLATADQRLQDAIAERDELRGRFPTNFDASLVGTALVGRHDVKLSTIYCSGLGCGTAPTVGPATISRNASGHLRLSVPKLAEGGLFAADGAVHLVVDSAIAVPACNGTSRTAGVMMTIFPAGYQIAADGTRTVSGLSAVVTVDAPATGDCPAGLAFYSAELTPAK